MTTKLTFDHDAELVAPADAVRACLIDPATLIRCVPGATLAQVDGNTLRGRMRIKLRAAPTECIFDARVSQRAVPDDAITLEGHATDRRSGSAARFRLVAVVTESGTDQARCRLSGELDGVHEDSAAIPARAVADRLLPQFIRRLEELSSEPIDLAETEDRVDCTDSDASQAGRQPVSSRVVRGIAAASAGVAAGRRAGRVTGRWIARRVRFLAARR